MLLRSLVGVDGTALFHLPPLALGFVPGKPYHRDVCVNECPNYGIMLSVFSCAGGASGALRQGSPRVLSRRRRFYESYYPTPKRDTFDPKKTVFACAAARRDHTSNAFQHHEAPATSTPTQTAPRRRAAPVRDGAPSNPKASEPSQHLRGSRRLVKVAVGVRVERVVEA